VLEAEEPGLVAFVREKEELVEVHIIEIDLVDGVVVEVKDFSSSLKVVCVVCMRFGRLADGFCCFVCR